MASLLVYDPKKNKKVKVGEFYRDWLLRQVGPEHFMHVVQGYGIQEVAFQQLVKTRMKGIALREIHTGDTLIASLQTWLDSGRVADYGHGKQRFLSVKFMRRKKHENPVL